MLNTLTIFRREMAAYFNSAIAYIFIIVFILMTGGIFMTQFFLIGRAEMRSFFATLPFTLAVFLPAVTMRVWAEDKRAGTLELLLTFPMKPAELVLGKFLASYVFYLAALAGTLTVPVMLHLLGSPDTGAIAGGYLGAAFLGAFYIAVGVFISGLVRDQIVAFILAMLACFALYFAGLEFFAASVDSWLPGAGSFMQRFIGSARHFDAFARGVIDNRDVLYFMTGTVLFLVLNGFWLEGRMRPRAKTIFSTAVLIAGGIFLAANMLVADVPIGRFDLTQGKLYTVSDATKSILRNLPSPVTAKLYISPSEKMPTGMKTLEEDIVGKLEELRVASQGNFQFRVVHMDTANILAAAGRAAGSEKSLEEQLRAQGIQPFQVQSIEADEVGVRLVYSSMALSFKEKPEEIIPHVMPESLFNLEYLIVSRIFRMTLPETPSVAVVAPFEEGEIDPAMAALLAQLGGRAPSRFRNDPYELIMRILEQEGYHVARIELTEEDGIPEGTDTLVILDPSELNDRQRYEINRFLAGGGSVLLAVQNYEFDYDPSRASLRLVGRDKNPGVNPLLEAWGLSVDRDILADEQSEVINLSAGNPFMPPIPVKTPVQILITPQQMNPEVSITSNLSSLFYLWGSALRIEQEKIRAQGLSLQILLYSSPASWTIPFRPGALSQEDFDKSRAVRAGPFPLAVMAQGSFADAFEGKPAPAWPETGEEEETAGEETRAPFEKAPGKLILFGAASFFDRNLIQKGGHGMLFMNSLDVLTLGEELVQIRSKQATDRSIGRVSPGQRIFWRLFVTVFVPLLIALAGFLRVFIRKQSKQKYLKKLVLQVK